MNVAREPVRVRVVVIGEANRKVVARSRDKTPLEVERLQNRDTMLQPPVTNSKKVEYHILIIESVG